MGSRTLFDHDPITGTSVWYEDLGEDGFALHTVADCEPVIDANKQLAGGSGRDHWKGEFRKEASIPDAVALKWFSEDGIRAWDEADLPRVIKKLNDPEWRYLKCADVIIGV